MLIKSRYAVIFLESIDEEYVLKQLAPIAYNLRLSYYQWSITEGLRKSYKEGSYYQTKEPAAMLRMVLELIKPLDASDSRTGLFVFKDFDKYLDDAIVLRLFKDLINKIKNTRNTVVILAPTYKLPTDIEPYSAHIVGGYPSKEEIVEVIYETIEEFKRSNKPVTTVLSDRDAEKITQTLVGLSTQQIRNVLAQCILDDGTLNVNDLHKIELCKKEIFDREGILEFCISEDKGNIANFDNLKRWLSERRGSFSADNPQALPAPKGVLLMGVQGCGKSLAIKVVARELNLALYRLDLSRLYSKYIGETEQNLRKALKTVEKLSPLCLWIDEIEKCFAASGGDIDGGVSQRMLGTFLTWMQERKSNCFIAATANNIYMLPPEFLRKGRFDEIFFVDLPDLELRSNIFRIHLAKRKLNQEKFDCLSLAEKSFGFNGAEIEQAVISALYRASSRKESVSTAHIAEQLESTKPLAVIKREEIEDLRQWARERTVPA